MANPSLTPKMANPSLGRHLGRQRHCQLTQLSDQTVLNRK